jgi:hypothetical protein
MVVNFWWWVMKRSTIVDLSFFSTPFCNSAREQRAPNDQTLGQRNAQTHKSRNWCYQRRCKEQFSPCIFSAAKEIHRHTQHSLDESKRGNFSVDEERRSRTHKSADRPGRKVKYKMYKVCSSCSHNLWRKLIEPGRMVGWLVGCVCEGESYSDGNTFALSTRGLWAKVNGGSCLAWAEGLIDYSFRLEHCARLTLSSKGRPHPRLNLIPFCQNFGRRESFWHFLPFACVAGAK